MKHFPKITLKDFTTWTALIVIFIHNVVLDVDMSCSCRPQAFYCYFYLLGPFGVYFLLQLWTDKKLQKVLNRSCSFVGIILNHIIPALSISLLWIVSVLIDGDWYVCCQNDQSNKQAKLACLEKNNITLEDHAVIAELKNLSYSIGLGVFIVIVALSWVWSCLGRIKNCSERCGTKCVECYGTNISYYELILEEGQILLEEKLRNKAKQHLEEEFMKINDKDWEQWFDAADKLIMKELQQQEPQQQEPQQQEQQQQEPQQQEQQQQEQQQQETEEMELLAHGQSTTEL